MNSRFLLHIAGYLNNHSWWLQCTPRRSKGIHSRGNIGVFQGNHVSRLQCIRLHSMGIPVRAHIGVFRDNYVS